MATLKLLWIVALSTIFIGLSQALKDVEIKDLKCEYNEEVANNITCKASIDHGKKHIMDLSSTLLREVKDVVIHFQISRLINSEFINVVNTTEDFCSFMESKSAAFYTEMVLKMLRDKSNIDHPCPYSGFVYVDSINPDPKMIPPNVPNGEYGVDITMYETEPGNFLGRIKLVLLLNDA